MIIWAADVGLPKSVDIAWVRRFAEEYADIDPTDVRDDDADAILEEYLHVQHLCGSNEDRDPQEIKAMMRLEEHNMSLFGVWYGDLPHSSPEEVRQILLG